MPQTQQQRLSARVTGEFLDESGADMVRPAIAPKRNAGQVLGLLLPMVGVVLVASVIAWRLLAFSFHDDVREICWAEHRSGLSLPRDMPALTQWIRSRLSTPEGNELFSSLADVDMATRSDRLTAEASALGLRGCPIASSYARLTVEGRERADMQRLCSMATFPDFAALDDDARSRALADWIDSQAQTPRTQRLADVLRRGETPGERARVLRESAGEVDVLSCDIAKALEAPPTATGPGALP